MPSRGCGTCRDRKVRCDLAAPVCQRCTRAGRKCQGYGLRLSWPKECDARRMIVVVPQKLSGDARKSSRLWIVNVSPWDFELQDYLSSVELEGRSKLSPPILPASIGWRLFKLNNAENDLLQYFALVASYSLTPLGYSPSQIRHVLLRLALSDSTAPAMAVMQSLLGLASLHRFGPQSHAARLKISAIQTLAASLTRGISTREGMQYIAAGMLLCSYEAQGSSDTSGELLSHIRGVKDVITTFVNSHSLTRDAEMISLLDWVFYHDALSRFSLRHWRRQDIELKPYTTEPEIMTMWCAVAPMGGTPLPISSSRKILCHLSIVCDTFIAQPDSICEAEDRDTVLKMLHWEIKRIPLPEIEDEDSKADETSSFSSSISCGIELCQLAALVYLEQAAGSSSEKKSRLAERIERAFNIFAHMEVCERSFPLLILACEARNDDQRIIILELMARTRKNSPVRSMVLLESMIRSLWVQDDLSDGEISYLDRLSVVISTSEGFPILI